MFNKRMNKRGQITLAITVWMILIVAVLALLLFLGAGGLIVYLTTHIFVTLAIVLMVFGAIVAIRGDMTENRKKVVFTMFGIGLVILLFYGFGLVSNTSYLGNNYIQVPLWGYYKCDHAQSATTELLDTLSYSSTTHTYSCPSNTDTCTITMSPPSSIGTATTATITYNANGITGQAVYSGTLAGYLSGNLFSGKTIPTVTLSQGQSLKVIYSASTPIGSPNVGTSKVVVTYTPFTLWKYDPLGGGMFKPGVNLKQGCTFNAGEAAYLIKADSLGIGIGDTNSIETLGFYQVRNFISGEIPISVENNKFQNNGQAYCMQNTLYKIDSVNTTLDSYLVVNTNKVVGTVTCCNGDVSGSKTCVNNKWVSSSSGTPPDYTGNCPSPTNSVYNSTALVKQVNVNGVCTNTFTKVECTSDSACKDSAKPSCDLNSYTCVAALSYQTQPLPGTVVQNCASLQTKYPFLNYQYVESQSTSCGFICSIGLSKPTITTTPECKSQVLPYLEIFLVVLVIVVGVVVYLIKTKKRR
jgi:hypothetical protein